MAKPQRISPVQLNLLLTQRLILAELLKISDMLGKKPLLADYSLEAQRRTARETQRSLQGPAVKKPADAALKSENIKTHKK